MARTIFEHKYHGGRSNSKVVEEDGRSKTITTHNVEGILKDTLARRNSAGNKSSTYFNSRMMHGDRVIAQIPKLVLIKHPEICESDEELAKFLDKNPWYKTIDVGWTKTTKERNLHLGGIKK